MDALKWLSAPVGSDETQRARFGAKKKTRLLNGPGPGNKGRPAGRIQHPKTYPTRPVVIPKQNRNFSFEKN